MAFIDEMFDESELLTDDDKAALDAEERGEVYEAAPEPSPEVVETNREMETQVAAEREHAARLDERRRIAEDRQQEQEPPSRLGERPDPSYDPIRADLWDVKRENEILAHRFEQQQIERQQQEFANWVNNDAAQFRAKQADYDQAANHAYQWRVKYWMGLGRPEAAARRIVDQETAATAMLARQNGKSAAAAFYELGKQLAGAAQARQQQPVRQRQPASTRGKATTKPQSRMRTALDFDAMPESELEDEIRRNPRAVSRAFKQLGV